MKTLILLCTAAVLLTPHLEAARKKKDEPLPPFQVGVTGIMARPANPTIVPVTVAEVTAGTPAEGKLRVDDVLVAVNGTKLEAPDPRPALGDAITEAEAKDGRLAFTVERGGRTEQVTLTIPVLGAYPDFRC
jgi:hypothetical protein